MTNNDPYTETGRKAAADGIPAPFDKGSKATKTLELMTLNGFDVEVTGPEHGTLTLTATAPDRGEFKNRGGEAALIEVSYYFDGEKVLFNSAHSRGVNSSGIDGFGSRRPLNMSEANNMLAANNPRARAARKAEADAREATVAAAKAAYEAEEDDASRRSLRAALTKFRDDAQAHIDKFRADTAESVTHSFTWGGAINVVAAEAIINLVGQVFDLEGAVGAVSSDGLRVSNGHGEKVFRAYSLEEATVMVASAAQHAAVDHVVRHTTNGSTNVGHNQTRDAYVAGIAEFAQKFHPHGDRRGFYAYESYGIPAEEMVALLGIYPVGIWIP